MFLFTAERPHRAWPHHWRAWRPNLHTGSLGHFEKGFKSFGRAFWKVWSQNKKSWRWRSTHDIRPEIHLCASADANSPFWSTNLQTKYFEFCVDAMGLRTFLSTQLTRKMSSMIRKKHFRGQSMKVAITQDIIIYLFYLNGFESIITYCLKICQIPNAQRSWLVENGIRLDWLGLII